MAKWIQNTGIGKLGHKGALRKALHAKKGQPIPAAHSKNPKLRKRAVLAQTLKRIHA